MFPIGTIVKLVLYLAIVLVIAGGAWYVTGLRADLAVSEANNQKLEDGIREQQSLIEMMQKDIATIQETNKQLAEQNEKQRQDVDNLARKFDKRDFGVFAIDNTEKAEQLVNRGTKDVMRCLELASGAPLNEMEKNAKSPVEANRQCPSLVDPSFKPILN
jgi:TolA-binding protein